MKVRNLGFIISLLVIGASVVGMIAGVAQMSQSVEELAVEMTKSQADVILASANVENEASVTVPILYYDQKMDDCVDLYSSVAHVADGRQFEWSECGYQNFVLEEEIVGGELSSEFLPVAVGGEVMTNRGIKYDFSRWFSQVDGKSKSYGSTINLIYDAKTASLKYENNAFYPLDALTMSATEGEWMPRNESVNNDGHNHLFTANLGVPIQVLMNGSERFEITADDDTWVFVDNKLVIDLGGIHEAMKAAFEIRNTGEVYSGINGNFAFAGVKLEEGGSAVIRVYHADRDSGTDSVFNIALVNMVPNITNTTIANVSEPSDGMEIAYDPSNPSYVAPLGESLTVKPNRGRALKTAVTVQVMVVGVFAVVAILAVSVGLRAWKKR